MAFFAKSAEHVRAAEGLVHADEVQTGFGRCGTHYWGFEQHNITPDMVTMAKGIANGMPMAVVAMSKDIANSMDPKKLTFQTYSVNPLSIAAGREVLRVIDDEGLMENSLKRGNQFIKGLTELQSVHKQIGDIRGSGLMLGIELVRDQDSKAPVEPEFFADVYERTKDYGLLLGKCGRNGNILRNQPVMCLTEEDVDFALDVLDQSLKEASAARK